MVYRVTVFSKTLRKVQDRELDYIVMAWDGDGFSICIGFFRKRRFSKNYVNQAMISISIG